MHEDLGQSQEDYTHLPLLTAWQKRFAYFVCAVLEEYPCCLCCELDHSDFHIPSAQGREYYTSASADSFIARCILHLCSNIKDTDPQAVPSSVACAEGLGVMKLQSRAIRGTQCTANCRGTVSEYKSDTSSTAARQGSTAIFVMLFLFATSLGAREVPLLPVCHCRHSDKGGTKNLPYDALISVGLVMD